MNWLLRYQTFLLYAVLACITAAIYRSGLNGGFILDDFPNLSLLALLPEDGNLRQILNLSTGGIASDVGRPLAMLSFLLQAEAWPGDPYRFKLVNLFIHLTNGVLIVWFCLQLGKIDQRLKLSPLLLTAVAALWLLHPIQVSSVLYVVQRMNSLASMFVLLGLVSYLWSRDRYATYSKQRYLFLMIGSPLLFSTLGLLSKETGAMLYVYLLVLELTLLDTSQTTIQLRHARKVAVYLPLTLGILGFLYILPGAMEGYAQKPFSLWERSLSQFPVLLSYIGAIALPFPEKFGLFHDSFPVFDSLFSVAAGASVLVITTLIASAIYFRKRHRFYAFCMLWFFGGHALESTVLPLELYFEHRNYLPSIGLILGLILLLNRLKADAINLNKKVVAGVVVASLCWVSTLTAIESSLWGDNVAQATAELERRPSSYRAQVHLVQTVTEAGDPRTGFTLHQQFMAEREPRIFDYIRWIEFGCMLQGIEFPQQRMLETAASEANMDYSAVGQLNRIVPATLSGACPEQLLPMLITTIEALLENENFEASWPDLLYSRAIVYHAEGNIEQAVDLAAESFDLRPNVTVGLSQLRWLAEFDRSEDIRAFLAIFESEFAVEIATREGLTTQLTRIRDQLE